MKNNEGHTDECQKVQSGWNDFSVGGEVTYKGQQGGVGSEGMCTLFNYLWFKSKTREKLAQNHSQKTERNRDQRAN